MSDQETPLPKPEELLPLVPVKDRLPTLPPKLPPVPHGMIKFTVYRRWDRSGVSGKGLVVQGVIFADGQCAYQWMNGKNSKVEYREKFEEFELISLLGHPENYATVTYEDGTEKHYYPKDSPESRES